MIIYLHMSPVQKKLLIGGLSVFSVSLVFVILIQMGLLNDKQAVIDLLKSQSRSAATIPLEDARKESTIKAPEPDAGRFRWGTIFQIADSVGGECLEGGWTSVTSSDSWARYDDPVHRFSVQIPFSTWSYQDWTLVPYENRGSVVIYGEPRCGGTGHNERWSAFEVQTSRPIQEVFDEQSQYDFDTEFGYRKPEFEMINGLRAFSWITGELGAGAHLLIEGKNNNYYFGGSYQDLEELREQARTLVEY